MHPTAERILNVAIAVIYGRRRLVFAILLAFTAAMLTQALRLKPDAGFEKLIPLEHPYMQVFQRYQQAFGGANLISVALIQRKGDIYNAQFLDALKRATDEVFFLPGVDRARVQSLFTPGVRYIEIVEGGFAGGDVVPRNYAPSAEMFALIRANVGKAGLIGRLVANDQRGALIVAELLERHPVTGARLDYAAVANELERIRAKFESDEIAVHITGFAKTVGDVTDANAQVGSFFILALALTVLLLWAFCGSLRLALIPLSAAVAAVIWELGLLTTFGFGLDPLAILVPFLILSVGVSHGVQYINGWAIEVTEHGRDSASASLATFQRLFIPGSVAILTDMIGFAMLAFIRIEIVREMAINAALGMAAVIVTNKIMLPIALTYVNVPDADKFRRRALLRQRIGDRVWAALSVFASRRGAIPMLLIAAVALAWALARYPDLRVGDVQAGVPELKPDARYNLDAAAIARSFAIGVDLLKVIAETRPYGCVDNAVMASVDRYVWHMQNTPGVAAVLSLPTVARAVRQGLNEGSPKWRVLPRNEPALAQIVAPVAPSSGLQNPDCSAMPVLIFTVDHRSETIASIVERTKDFNRDNEETAVNFALAAGNVGVMAATNEEIAARELWVIVWVHATLAFFAWLSFRTLVSVVSILAPLVLCSLLTYALMATVGIGMKPATLPVAAFGVGIGVDYAIYLWSALAHFLEQKLPLRQAYEAALRHTGKAVVFTSAALTVSVFTWTFSELQFQADMGLLLMFMFATNLLGALLLLPALAWLFMGRDANRAPGSVA